MEIGKAIRVYDREITKKRVANRNNLDYNALKRESEKENTVEDANESTENSRNEERSQDYGTDISEELKSKDQMKWIQLMGSIRHSAEEIVLTELIYN